MTRLEELQAQLAEAQAEIKRLKRVVAQELSENDGLGSEYTYVNTLKEQLAQEREKRERYEAALQSIERYGNNQTCAQTASEALGKDVTG